jgi:uncharacterized protein with HEPN domain
MHKRNHILYLQDILNSILRIEQFIQNITEDEFKQDEKTQYAVIRAFEIIGEASKKISQDIKENHSDIPWREISGMRDKLIHDYVGVNTAVIWKTATEDIPTLKRSIEEIIKNIK